jgi:Fic family protein
LLFYHRTSTHLSLSNDCPDPRRIQPPSAGKKGIDGFKAGLSADNYISISKTSRATATRDRQDLVEKGALIKIGELRHTRYFLNIDERSES